MTRIAVLDDYQGAAAVYGPWETLPSDSETVTFADHVHDPQALVARLRHFDVVVAMRERTAFPRQVLERLPELRLLVTTGYRNAAIDVAAATDQGIVVCGTGGYLPATVELTWGLIIGVLRHIPEEHACLRSGGWQHTIGGDLSGGTLGVVGLGNMGRLLARIGKAFDMNVIAWSQNLTKELCSEHGVELVSKDELFRTSDVVSLHLQLSERTRGLVGRAELGLMKPTSILINTSRGPIVDEPALVDALRSGRIAGAGIDVFDPEPIAQDHPLRSAPNLITTPHLGYVTRNTYRVFLNEAVEDIAAFLEGTPVRVIAHD